MDEYCLPPQNCNPTEHAPLHCSRSALAPQKKTQQFHLFPKELGKIQSCTNQIPFVSVK